MKQTAVEFIVEQLDCLNREKKERLIDSETYFKHRKALIEEAKEREKNQLENSNIYKKVKNMNFPRINNLLENIKSLENFKTEGRKIKNMQTSYDKELLTELEELLIKSNDETLIHFIDWFGTWQTNKILEDYGVNDILYAYKQK